MRHYKKGRKLGTDASHTKAIKKNLVVNIFINDRIKTTLERAKEIRGDIDQVITWAKRGDVHSRRLAIAKLGDKDLVAEIFSKVEQGMFKDRPGGYSRIMRLGTRRGDSATIVIMELVQEPYIKKDKAGKDAAKGAAKGAGKDVKAAARNAVVKPPKKGGKKAEEAAEEVEAVEAEAAEAEAAEAAEEVVEVEAVEEAAEVEAEVAEEAAPAEEAEPEAEEAAANEPEAKAEKTED